MRDAEIFGKENFNRVIKELASQASKIRVEGWISTSAPRVDEQVQEPDEDVNENRSDIKKRNKKQDMNRKSKKSRDESTVGEESPKFVPDFLNPKCGGNHWMDQCPNTEPELRKKLITEFKENRSKKKPPISNGKNKERKGSVKRLFAERIDSHSALFSGSFAAGAVECEVLTDSGSDRNLMSTSSIKPLVKHKTGTDSSIPNPHPSIEELRLCQQDCDSAPAGSVINEDGLIVINEKIWIPDNQSEVKLEIMISSHCGELGHRGKEATMSVVKENFTWTNMKSDISKLVS